MEALSDDTGTLHYLTAVQSYTSLARLLLQWLPARDLCALRLVSKRCKHIATQNQLWENLYTAWWGHPPERQQEPPSTGNQLLDYRLKHQRAFYQQQALHNGATPHPVCSLDSNSAGTRGGMHYAQHSRQISSASNLRTWTKQSITGLPPVSTRKQYVNCICI